MRSLDKCLDDVRPRAISVDGGAQSASAPAAQRERPLRNWGELQIQIGNRGRYLSLRHLTSPKRPPFVVPRARGGPDFFPRERAGRPPNAPRVGVQEFVAGMAQRAESQMRNDWTAVPAMRHALSVWLSEHTMSTLRAHEGGAGSALRVGASEFVVALQELYEVLHDGSVGT